MACPDPTGIWLPGLSFPFSVCQQPLQTHSSRTETAEQGTSCLGAFIVALPPNSSADDQGPTRLLAGQWSVSCAQVTKGLNQEKPYRSLHVSPGVSWREHRCSSDGSCP